MNINEFKNNIIAYNDDNIPHVEVYYSDKICDRKESDNSMKCDSKGIGSYKAPEDKDDLPVCLDCLIKEEIFKKLHCEKCKGIIFNKDDTKIRIKDCKCNAIKKLKEKPILESQWVRVRDYQ